MVVIWMKYAVVAVLACGSILIARMLVRKFFNIVRVNEETPEDYYSKRSQRKVDNILREYSSVLLVIVLVMAIVSFDGSFSLVLIAAYGLLAVRELVKAYLEWNYSDHPKQAIVTITDVVVFSGIVIAILQTNYIP